MHGLRRTVGLQCTGLKPTASEPCRNCAPTAATQASGDLGGYDMPCSPPGDDAPEFPHCLRWHHALHQCLPVKAEAAEQCTLVLPTGHHGPTKSDAGVDGYGSSRRHRAAGQRPPRAATATRPLRLAPASCCPRRHGLEPLPPCCPKPGRAGCESAGHSTPERQRNSQLSPSAAQEQEGALDGRPAASVRQLHVLNVTAPFPRTRLPGARARLASEE